MPASPSVAIIGAGFGGVATAVQARRAGIEDIVILDRAPRRRRRLGGQHLSRARRATCPRTCTRSRSRRSRAGRGASRRSPRSAPTSRASRATSGSSRMCASGRGRGAPRWTSEAGRWHLERRGRRRRRVRRPGHRLRAAHAARDPDARRASTSFAGDAFHSAEWDHDVDLRGRRVAVIGTGASAIQFVPEIAPQVARSVDVFQRSAPWMLPKFDTRVPPAASSASHERSPASSGPRPAWRAVLESLGVRLHRPPAAGPRASTRRDRAPTASAASELRGDPALLARRDAGLPARLQAHPHHERLVPDAAAPTSSS